MVFCELVLDQWGLKAYKSATAESAGFVLSSILSACRTRRARIPSVPRLNVARRFSRSGLESLATPLARVYTRLLSRSIDPRRDRMTFSCETRHYEDIIKAFIAGDYDFGVSRR